MNPLLALAVLRAVDGGPERAPAPAPAVSAEDQEVIEQLELLENLEGAADLELLQDL